MNDYIGLEEEENENTAALNGTAEDTLDAARDKAGEAVDNVTGKDEMPSQETAVGPVQQADPVQPSAPTYSNDEIISHLKSGVDYSQDEINAMSDEQYANYHKVADDYYREHPTAEDHTKRLELADELQKKAQFVAEHTDGDENFKDDHDEAAYASDFLQNHTSAFTKMDDEGKALWVDKINRMYDDANKRRGHIEVLWDSIKRGVLSAGNMMYQGSIALKPEELTKEDSYLINGSMKAKEDLEIAMPRKMSGVENIGSVGDAVDYLSEGVGENLARGLAAMGMSTIGAILGGSVGGPIGATVGAISFGTLGTMALNTGEAVQDQMDENRNDGDIRNSRAWAVLQGFGYSLLDGAFGVNKWGAGLIGGLLRKAGLKEAVKAAEIAAMKETAKRATIKGAAKELILKGGAGEGLQEMAQSQGVGRGIRYLQTGSIFRKKEDGSYESVGDAFLEAVNEFAGGASVGLTLGLLGGAPAHIEAKRVVNAYDKIEDALKNDKYYKALDEYGKLLVKRHLINDSFLATTETISPEVRASLEESNKNIDAEIKSMMNGKGSDRVVGENARMYLDIFKSQYTLDNIGDVLMAQSDGSYMSRDGKVYKTNVDADSMRQNSYEVADKDGNRSLAYTDPSTHITIIQQLDNDGNPTGKYSFNNDPSRKSPVFGSTTDSDGNKKSELECDSLEEALEKCRQLDAYNQWRADKMNAKAEVANQVFSNLFGGRGVNLKFVDRPTNGNASVGISTAAFKPKDGIVELSLDNINSIGELYTTLMHERSHQDLVEFLMKSGKWTKTVNGKQVIDWDQFEKDRDELFAKVSGAEEMSKKYRDASGKATFDWGKSAGRAGEEMLVERSSIFDLANRVRDIKRGVFGSIEDRIRKAIGMKMAMDMKLDPRMIAPADVATEVDKLFDLGYIGNPAPAGFEREKAEYDLKNVEPQEDAILTPRQFVSKFGDPVDSSVDQEGNLDIVGDNFKEEGKKTSSKAPKAKSATTEGVKPNTETVVAEEKPTSSRAETPTDAKPAAEPATKPVEAVADTKVDNVPAKEEFAPEASNAHSTESVNEEAPKAEEPETKTESESTVVEEGKDESKPEAAKEEPAERKPIEPPATSKVKAEEEKSAKDETVAEKPEEKPTESKDGGEASETPKDPVTVNPDEGTVSIAVDGKKKSKAKKKKIPAKLKKRIVESSGLEAKAMSPEVEARWLELDALPEGSVIKVDGDTFTKSAVDDQNADRRWSGKKTKRTTQFLLARKGDFRVVSEPKAEVETKPATPVVEEVKPETPKAEETPAKPAEPPKAEPSPAAVAKEPVVVKEDKYIIDLLGESEFSFMSDRQRPVIIELYHQNGKINQIINSPNNDGMILVVQKKGSLMSVVSRDGKILSPDEMLKLGDKSNAEVESDGKDEGVRSKSILTMPQISESSQRTLGEALIKNIGIPVKYSGLSDDALLALCTKKEDYTAILELWNRWVVNPPDRLNGGLIKWFKDKGIADKDIPQWLDRTWNEVKNALRESDYLEVDKIRDKESSESIRQIEKSLKYKSQSGAAHRGSPLGRNVTADSFIYSIVNDLIGGKISTDYAEKQRTLQREREAERAAIRARQEANEAALAYFSGKTVEQMRMEKAIALSTKISPIYKTMDKKELFHRCVPNDGMPADIQARQEVELEVMEMLFKTGYIYNRLRLGGVGESYAGDAYDSIIDIIHRQWKDPEDNSLWKRNNDINDKSLETFVRRTLDNLIKEYERKEGRTKSLDAKREDIGDAAEYDPDNPEVDNEDNSTIDNALLTLDGKHGDTQFGKAIKGLRRISAFLPKQRSMLLQSLMNAWKERINAASEALLKVSGSKPLNRKMLRICEKDLAAANRGDFLGDKGVIEYAAMNMGMKPMVYRAKLGQLIDDIRNGFLGERTSKKIKHGEHLKRVEKNLIYELSRGLFDRADSEESIGHLAKNGDVFFLLGYNDADIYSAMQYNGDELMRWCVNKIDHGMSNTAVQNAIMGGELSGLANRCGAMTVDTIMERAYSQYGWIDKRVDTDKRIKDLVLKLFESYKGDLKFDANWMIALERGDYKELEDKVGMWLKGNGVKYDSDKMVKAIKSVLKNETKRITDAEYQSKLKELTQKDHDEVSQLMAENGNNENTVKKILSERGNDEKRVTSMMTHYASVEKDNAKKAARQAERAAEEERDRGLTEKQKSIAMDLFNASKRKLDTIKSALKRAGWSDENAQKAYDYLSYQEDKRIRANEERIAAMSNEAKKAFVKSQIDGDMDLLRRMKDERTAKNEEFDERAYIEDIRSRARDFAINEMQMDELLANAVVDNALPPGATVYTNEEMQSRRDQYAGTLGMTESQIKAAEEAERVDAEKQKPKRNLGLAKKVLDDAEHVKELIGKFGDDGVANALAKELKDKAKKDYVEGAIGRMPNQEKINKMVYEMLANYYKVYGDREVAKATPAPSEGNTSVSNESQLTRFKSIVDLDISPDASVPALTSIGGNADIRRGFGVRLKSQLVTPEIERSNEGNSDIRYKSQLTNSKDPNVLFPAKESLKTHGLLPKDYKGRTRKRDVVLDREAEALIANHDEYSKAVARAMSGGAITDVEVRAMELDIANRMAAGIENHLTAEEFDLNEGKMDELVQALVRGLSQAGAALNQAKHGFNLRTRDTAVYIRAKVKAKLEGEVGLGGVNSAEVEQKLKELESRIQDQARELAECHKKIDEQNSIIAKKEADASEKAKKRIANEAWKEGYEAARQDEVKNRKKRIDQLTNLGFSKDKSQQADDMLFGLGDLFGVNERHAGNPKVELTDKHRTLFAGLIDAAEGNVEMARRALIERVGEVATPFFDQYVTELDRESEPVDGKTETKVRNRRRIVGERAKKAKVEKSPSRSWLVDKLQDKIANANLLAQDATDEEIRMSAIGDSARNWFKLAIILGGNDVKEATLSTLKHINSLIEGMDDFDEADVNDAILGRGAFKPMSRSKAMATTVQLKKALELAQQGKMKEAAKTAGIEDKDPVQMVDELTRRLETILDNKLNSLASDPTNASVKGEVDKLNSALKDIRSGNKSANDILAQYLDLAVGMKHYRRQASLADRIQARIAMYERKIANEDFDTPAKVDAPDVAEEVATIQNLMRKMERIRQRHKHERDAWRMKKLPWASRQVVSILDILGESKAVVGAMDLSSMLRQGGQLTWAHPLLFAKNFKRTWKALRSVEAAESIMNEIFNRPNARYYLLAGIEFTDWGSSAVNKEEPFLLNQFRRFTKMKYLKAGIEMSERAFSMFLNMMRADVFDAMVACSPMRDASRFSIDQLKAIGDYINIASQRGVIDRNSSLGKALPLLNTVLWSPRNIVSRFQFIKNTLLLGIPGFKSYGTTDWTMRKMFARETLRYLTGVAVTILFTKMMADLLRGDDEPPEDLVLNPTSSDFLKVKIGNTRLDFLSGLQPMFVFGARVFSRKNTNVRGETRDIKNPSDYGNLFFKFARSKFSPMASVIYDTALARETFDRQDISYSPKDQLRNDKDVIGFSHYLWKNVFCPLSFSDIKDQMQYSGIGFAPVSMLLTMLGAGVQAFDPYTYKQMSDDYRYFKRLFDETTDPVERQRLIEYHPMLKMAGPIESQIKRVNKLNRIIKKLNEVNGDTGPIEDLIEIEKKRAINMMAGLRHPMDVE